MEKEVGPPPGRGIIYLQKGAHENQREEGSSGNLKD